MANMGAFFVESTNGITLQRGGAEARTTSEPNRPSLFNAVTLPFSPAAARTLIWRSTILVVGRCPCHAAPCRAHTAMPPSHSQAPRSPCRLQSKRNMGDMLIGLVDGGWTAAGGGRAVGFWPYMGQLVSLGDSLDISSYRVGGKLMEGTLYRAAIGTTVSVRVQGFVLSFSINDGPWMETEVELPGPTVRFWVALCAAGPPFARRPRPVLPCPPLFRRLRL